MKYDVAIIGAGPSGLVSAINLAKVGLSIVVIDEYFKPGGRLLGQLYDDRKAPPQERNWDGEKITNNLVKEARELGVNILCEVTVWSINKGWTINITSHSEKKTINSDRILLATGAAEKPLPIPGWTLPGVFSIGAAQTLTNVHHVAIGERVFVIGMDPLSISVVMEMKNSDIDVVGVALPPVSTQIKNELSSPVRSLVRLAEVSDLSPNPILRGMGRLASGKFKKIATHVLGVDLLKIEGVPIHIRKSIISIEGNKRLESINIQSISVDGKPRGKIENIPVDAVCLSAGLYPLVDLAEVIGCSIVDIPELGGMVPLHGADLETSVHGVFVAGNIIGIEGAKVAMAQGELAASSIAESLGKTPLITKEEGINKIAEARNLSPINFLPNIVEGRHQMSLYWNQMKEEVNL